MIIKIVFIISFLIFLSHFGCITKNTTNLKYGNTLIGFMLYVSFYSFIFLVLRVFTLDYTVHKCSFIIYTLVVIFIVYKHHFEKINFDQIQIHLISAILYPLYIFGWDVEYYLPMALSSVQRGVVLSHDTYTFISSDLFLHNTDTIYIFYSYFFDVFGTSKKDVLLINILFIALIIDGILLLYEIGKFKNKKRYILPLLFYIVLIIFNFAFITGTKLLANIMIPIIIAIYTEKRGNFKIYSILFIFILTLSNSSWYILPFIMFMLYVNGDDIIMIKNLFGIYSLYFILQHIPYRLNDLDLLTIISLDFLIFFNILLNITKIQRLLSEYKRHIILIIPLPLIIFSIYKADNIHQFLKLNTENILQVYDLQFLIVTILFFIISKERKKFGYLLFLILIFNQSFMREAYVIVPRLIWLLPFNYFIVKFIDQKFNKQTISLFIFILTLIFIKNMEVSPFDYRKIHDDQIVETLLTDSTITEPTCLVAVDGFGLNFSGRVNKGYIGNTLITFKYSEDLCRDPIMYIDGIDNIDLYQSEDIIYKDSKYIILDENYEE